jgi:hypothetical protein
LQYRFLQKVLLVQISVGIAFVDRKALLRDASSRESMAALYEATRRRIPRIPQT